MKYRNQNNYLIEKIERKNNNNNNDNKNRDRDRSSLTDSPSKES